MMKPVISLEEYGIRKSKIQKMLDLQGLDVLIAYSDDRFTFGQAHARWICDYVPQFEPAFIIVPRIGDIVIATGAESEDYVLLKARGAEVRVVDLFINPDEEFLFTTVVPFSSVISEIERSIDNKIHRVGIAGDEMIPHKLFDGMRKSLPDASIDNVEPDLMKLRAIKSPDEIRVIEYAYKIAQAGMNAALSELKPGKTEREIAAVAEFAMRSMGSEGMGIMTMVASGFDHTHPILATTTNRVIQKDDLVCMTFAPRYEGYHGAIARPAVLGKPSKSLQHALDASIAAQKDTQEVLRPGTRGFEVDAASRRAVNDAGLGKHFVYTGVHSVGVVEFEPPIMTSESMDEIQENMVLSIDIPLFLNHEFGGFRIENGFLITKDGNRALNDLTVDYSLNF